MEKSIRDRVLEDIAKRIIYFGTCESQYATAVQWATHSAIEMAALCGVITQEEVLDLNNRVYNTLNDRRRRQY